MWRRLKRKMRARSTGNTNVGHENDYLDLLNQITAIDPSRNLAAELVRLAHEPVRQDDPLRLLLLAEWAANAQQWQAAAQLYCRMMATAFGGRYIEAHLVERAKCIGLLITRRPVDLSSRADLVLYCHTRLMDCLEKDGIETQEAGEWIVAAFSSLLRGSPDRIAAVRAAYSELHPGNRRIGEHYCSEIGPVRRLMECSLRLQDDERAWVWVDDQGGRRNLTLLVCAVAAIAVFAWVFAGWFPLPASAALERYGIASWLRAAYVAWPLLLVATWVFACSESIRTRTFQFISPLHLLRGGSITSGEVMPFNRDWFFHIFQFVWIVLVAVAWVLFSECRQLPGWLPSVWNNAAPNSSVEFAELITVPFVPHVPQWAGLWSYLRAFFGSDLVSLTVATVACVYSIRYQREIQSERILHGTDFYWWDLRVNPVEWRVRLIMVGVDMFLVSFLVMKILAVLFAAYQLVISASLKISYFSPDGVGGLNQLINVLMYLSWIGFLFGLFVFASLYLHWNLHEYRRSDLTLVAAYVVFVALSIAPLGILETRLSNEGDTRIGQLTERSNMPNAGLEDLGKYVRDVNSVRDWKVSAIKMGVLKNPVLPLSFQLLVIFLQSLGRLGKLPRLPIPGFDSPSKDARG